jgi:hypothetical protein
VIRRRAGATPLTVLTPIRAGAEAVLAVRLRALPDGEGSPFHGLPGVHFARLVVIDRLREGYPGAPLPPSSLAAGYLLFTSTFDGTVAEHLAELRTRLGRRADDIWGHCIDYPGHDRQQQFLKYFLRNRIRENRWHRAYDATVPEIRAALDLRRRHVKFALRAQGLGEQELREAFRAEFGG